MISLRVWRSRKPKVAVLSCAVCLALLISWSAASAGVSFKESGSMYAVVTEPNTNVRIGTYADLALWRFTGLKEKIIFVCWENGDGRSPEMRIVREQILATWGKATGFQFEGWRKCKERSAGLRIFVSDGRPPPGAGGNATELPAQVIAYGRFLDSLQNGIILDFGRKDTASANQRACMTNLEAGGLPAGAARDACIRYVATHMFGHALGLRHLEDEPSSPAPSSEKAQECRPLAPDPNQRRPVATVMSCDLAHSPRDPRSLSESDLHVVRHAYRCELLGQDCRTRPTPQMAR